MQGQNTPESFRILLELEVTGNDQQVQAALRRHVREQREPQAGAGDLTSTWENSAQEDILSEIIGALQLKEQIRRVLHPLGVTPVSSGLVISRTRTAHGRDH